MARTPDAFAARTIDLHGHNVSYRMAGEGPAIVLVHGLAGSSTTWRGVMPALAERYTVIAPDLLGHGKSGKPRGDYSLGAYASGIRDRLYLASRVPALVGWGGRDAVIPVAHAYDTHEAIPGSRLEVLPDAGHFLPFEEPEWFAAVLLQFLDSTEPAVVGHDEYRQALLARGAGGFSPATSGSTTR